MYGINSDPPKNCIDCPLCQGEYGKGNEKSYCAIKSEVKLKYRGSRPKECPIIADPLPQWQIEFLKTLCEKVRPQGEWKVHGKQGGIPITDYCTNCKYEMKWYKNKYNFCPNCGARMVKNGNGK